MDEGVEERWQDAELAELPGNLHWVWGDFNAIGLSDDSANRDCIYSLHRDRVAELLKSGFIPASGASAPVFVYDFDGEIGDRRTVVGQHCVLELSSEGRSPVLARPVSPKLYRGRMKI